MIRRLIRRLTGRSPTPPTPRQPRPRQHRPTAPAPQAAPVPGASATPTLVLYKYDACPYCRRVQRVLEGLPLHVEQRDTRLDPAARTELRQRTGRTQVPCLFIDGTPLFESDDIIDWLESHARNHP